MPEEIERKFLVKDKSFKNKGKKTYIHQGFLNSSKERVVRVRITGKQAFLTVKGITVGATRLEYEYEIPQDEAREMLEKLCEKPTIEKYRYLVDYKGKTWEVDEFLGENEGLVVAELELEHEGQEFSRPDWLGEEVTGDPKYFNANLVQKPYREW